MPLFDHQTMSFLALKKAPRTAESETFPIAILPPPFGHWLHLQVGSIDHAQELRITS